MQRSAISEKDRNFSKTLTIILRWNRNIPRDREGFMQVDDILQDPSMTKLKATKNWLKHVCETNVIPETGKKRYSLALDLGGNLLVNFFKSEVSEFDSIEQME